MAPQHLFKRLTCYRTVKQKNGWTYTKYRVPYHCTKKDIIIGCVIGGVALLAFLGYLVYFCITKARSQRETPQEVPQAYLYNPDMQLPAAGEFKQEVGVSETEVTPYGQPPAHQLQQVLPYPEPARPTRPPNGYYQP